MSIESSSILSAAEAAELLGVTLPTITRMTQDGRLPAVRTRPYIFERAAVEQLAAERKA